MRSSRCRRLVQLQLVCPEAADRRIRSRSPHGQSVRSALRPPRPGVVPALVRRCDGRACCAATSPGPARWLVESPLTLVRWPNCRRAPRYALRTVDAWAEAFSAGVRRPGGSRAGCTARRCSSFKYSTTSPHTRAVDDRQVSTPGRTHLAAGCLTLGQPHVMDPDLVGDVPFADLVREAAAVPPGSRASFCCHTSASAPRSLIHAPVESSLGLTLRHQRGHLFRAVYEGIGFGIRQIHQLLDSDRTPVWLVAVGGGTPKAALDPGRQRCHRPRAASAGTDDRS